MRQCESLEFYNDRSVSVFDNRYRTFDYWWDSTGEQVEESNFRRGGVSKVVRAEIKLKSGSRTVYIKRQVNQLRRSFFSWFLPRPTFWIEQQVLRKIMAMGFQGTPEIVCYGERTILGKKQALLVVLALEGYSCLEELLQLPMSAEKRIKMMRLIGQRLFSMHSLKFEHGALYTKHIFLSENLKECKLIDFERGHFRLKPLTAMKNDLERLFRRSPELSKEDRLLILEPYGRYTELMKLERKFSQYEK